MATWTSHRARKLDALADIAKERAAAEWFASVEREADTSATVVPPTLALTAMLIARSRSICARSDPAVSALAIAVAVCVVFPVVPPLLSHSASSPRSQCIGAASAPT